MTGPEQVVEVDVAAVVAEEVARHAPGTSVSGPESGGVQVIRVSLDLTAFRDLLVLLATALGPGSHLRLDVFGGLVCLDVSGGNLAPDRVDPLRVLVAGMGGRIVPDPPATEGFSVQVPSGLREWD